MISIVPESQKIHKLITKIGEPSLCLYSNGGPLFCISKDFVFPDVFWKIPKYLNNTDNWGEEITWFVDKIAMEKFNELILTDYL